MSSNYYACNCGGAFYVDLKAQSYGIYPTVFVYVCDKCQRRKSMPCFEEVQQIARFEREFEREIPVKRVFTLR